MSELFSNVETTDQWAELARSAEPPPAIRIDEENRSLSREQALAAGNQLLADGKVAMILAAGGQGTRLGFDQPKGMFPVGPISNRTLFQILMEQVLARSQYFGKPIGLYIMTSPATHAATIRFLKDNKNFGMPPEDCMVFCQGTMPAVDAETGKLLLAEPGRLFLSPDGHGGLVAALEKNNCLEQMTDRGFETIFYGQIDNPLMQVCDPLTIGYHKLMSSEMTTQVVPKLEPLQRVGNVVSIDGRIQIIEYSDLPDDVAQLQNEAGKLKLWAGNIAVHVFEFSFLEKALHRVGGLPFHKARKVVPYVNDVGDLVEPKEKNAIKFERFIFDLLPLAQNSIAVEVDPRDGFAAVKNAPPATTETAETTKAAMIDLHTRWLRAAGVEVADGTPVEISPFFAFDQNRVREKANSISKINEPTYLTNP
jgi:UDP-N-acetylglucosamine/UDP-N-acetylgalactosamine diphosphorylase